MENSIKPTKKDVGREILIFFAIGVAFLLLRQGENLLGNLAFGLFVGCLYCHRRIIPSLLFVASGFMDGLWGGLIAFSQALVLVITTFFYSYSAKKIGKWWLLLYMVLANVLYFVYHFDKTNTLKYAVCFLVGIAFAYLCIFSFRAVFVRGLKYKSGADENVCIFLVCTALFRGLALIEVYGVNLLLPVAGFLIPLTLYCFGAGGAFLTATCLGFGEMLASGLLVTPMVFVLWTAVAVAFVGVSRFLSVSALLLTQVAIAYFFELYQNATTAVLIAVFVGCACFCLLPKRALERVKNFLGFDTNLYSPRQIVNRMRVNFSRRLYDLSEVFFSMERSFKSLTRGVLEPNDAVFAISNEIINNACKDCPGRAKCWRENAKATQICFETLVNCGIDRGRISLLDLPQELTSKCMRTSSVLSSANTEVSNYKQYYLVNSSYDNSRALLASVSDGIGKVMLALSKDSRSTVGFDTEKEKILLEQLTFYNVLVKEAVIFCENDSFSVAVVVDKRDADKPQIADVISKVCATPLFCCAKESLSQDDWCMLYFSQEYRFDMSVGIAKVAKTGSEISGDTYSFLKLPMGKYLIALCDGMGSGERAEQASSTAIGLIENFYRAGFDNDLIFNCINKLLTAVNSEVFTAVDICVVDLKNGLADFIKLGAPSGLVKTGESVTFIEGASLPVGIVEEIQPTITKKVLREGDFVLLASDGFWDSFDDKNLPAMLLRDCKLTNPEVIAHNLLEQALGKTNGTAKDDTTVIVAKIF